MLISPEQGKTDPVFPGDGPDDVMGKGIKSIASDFLEVVIFSFYS